MDALTIYLALCLPPCPPPVCLDDAWRFPPDPVIEETRAAGAVYRARLKALLDVEPHHAKGLELALAESERAEEAWGVLWQVRPAPVGWDTAPRADAQPQLERLRGIIGAGAYAVGAMPDICPRWTFRSAD